MTKPFPITPALLLATAIAAAAALAQGTEPLPVTEAYRYAVTDTRDALEIDWAIEDGYYLYRSELSFETDAPGIRLHDPILPQGITHEDEYFGKQQIFRERFYVRVPYTAAEERPESIELVIRSRGCWDGGICFPPQVWTETVALRQVDGPKLDLGTVGAAGGLGGGAFLPVDQAFEPILIPVDGNAIDVSFRITPGYYLYKEKIAVRTLSDKVQLGRLDLPDGNMKVDEWFGEMEVYYEDVFARLQIARATPEAINFELELDFQGCAEDGLCYPPQTRVLTVSLPAATAIADLSALPQLDAPVSEQKRIFRIIVESNIWLVISGMFGLGLLLALTPCVLPMIPILTSIIAGEGQNTSPARGFVLALSYVMGMAIVYTGAGVVAVAAGSPVQAVFNQPWVLSLFAGLFVILAFAMFGGYDLQMPSNIQSRLANLSSNQKNGTVIGAFVMGALSSLIVTACVAPAMVAALAVMSQVGDYFRGGVALFAMSLGMGAPLLLVGAAQGQFLPKVGPWMIAVKSAFGFMMLGLAIWMLSRFVDGTVILTLWAILAVVTGVFAGGLSTLTAESSPVRKLGKGFGFLLIVWGLLMLLGAFTGGSNPLRPLATVNLGDGTTIEDRQLEFTRIKTVADLDREIAAASAAGKTAMLDFYADWCVSCKVMEEYTFTDPAVQAALANTVALQADVTANDELDRELLARFGVFGPPTIIFFGRDGRQRRGYKVVGYMPAEDFVDHLQLAFGGPAGLSSQTD